MTRRMLPLLILSIVGFGTLYFVVASTGWLTNDGAGADESQSHKPTNALPVDVVSLSSGKAAVAGIQTSRAEIRMLQPFATVPGRIQYDDARHVAIRTAVGGILVDTRIKPGDRVAVGDVLAIVNSPEVGQARADILERQAAYELAARHREVADDIRDGVMRLINGIEAGKSPEELRSVAIDRKLGSYREQLISACTRYQLAQQSVTGVSQAIQSGAISRRVAQQRDSEHDAAQAALTAAIEQADYETRVQSHERQLQADDARRRLELARQQLQSLLAIRKTDDSALDPRSVEMLAEVEIRAPFDGTIQQKAFSVSERVVPGETLIILADTSRLWVAADVREQEWPALDLDLTDPITVVVPALNSERMPANLHYVGREVSLDTNAIPIVAGIDNAAGKLRPGLFVRVELPLADGRSVLAIPDSCLLDHAGVRFVFIRTADQTFERRNVRTGIESAGRVEVVSGLVAGDEVVSHGAFILKSELLLEGDEE